MDEATHRLQLTARHNVPGRVQKPLESRYWSAVTQNISKVAEKNWKKGWNEEAGRSGLACGAF